MATLHALCSWIVAILHPLDFISLRLPGTLEWPKLSCGIICGRAKMTLEGEWSAHPVSALTTSSYKSYITQLLSNSESKSCELKFLSVSEMNLDSPYIAHWTTARLET